MELGTITYLDNAAAMPVDQDILKRFKEFSEKYYANPEAAHEAGREASLCIKNAAERIVDELTGKGDYSLIWASSATEAINIGVSYSGFRGKAILTTGAEHSAMKGAIESGDFCEIRRSAIRSDGLLDLKDFESKLDKDVAVISIHHVQNESGAIQKLIEIGKIIAKKAPEAVFMVDTVQSAGKIPIPWNEAGINIGFIGGHKVGAPSGGALIYNLPKNKKKEFEKYLNKIRYEKHSIGRPDIPICLTLADAVIKASGMANSENVISLNKSLRQKLSDLKFDKKLNLLLPVPEEFSSPYITTLLVPPYQGEVLVRMLSDKGVMVSAGSACEASKSEPSSTLLAMGISPSDARTSLRISFSFYSTENDVDRFIEALNEVVDGY